MEGAQEVQASLQRVVSPACSTRWGRTHLSNALCSAGRHAWCITSDRLQQVLRQGGMNPLACPGSSVSESQPEVEVGALLSSGGPCLLWVLYLAIENPQIPLHSGSALG